jgi:hypothetical protein
MYTEHDLTCPEPGCGAPLALKPSQYGVFYGCTQWAVTGCRGSHSAHKATGEPMGTPATAETKDARKAAHTAFDQLWMGGPINWKRDAAYQWLKEKMGLTEEAHFGNFTLEQCQRAIAFVRQEFESRGLPLLDKIPPKQPKKEKHEPSS